MRAAPPPSAPPPPSSRPQAPGPRRRGRPRRPTSPPPRPTPPDSRHRLLTAATTEFAARGFAGATVDRIAARARLNKAMIYYHFHDKQQLYSSVLRTMFSTIGDRLDALAAEPAPPFDKLDRFAQTFLAAGLDNPHFAPIMLREIAEGGRHLDEQTYTMMARLVRVMMQLIDEGRTAGQFDEVDPILVYLTTVWPIMAYLGVGPIRRALARVARIDPARLDPDKFLRHVQRLNRRALAPQAGRRKPAPRAPRAPSGDRS